MLPGVVSSLLLESELVRERTGSVLLGEWLLRARPHRVYGDEQPALIQEYEGGSGSPSGKHGGRASQC